MAASEEEVAGRRALQQSEERFRLLVDSVVDYAIFMLDPDGFVTSWNAGAERIKGYGGEEALGEHLSLFYTDEAVDEGRPERLLAVAREQGRVEDSGWRVRKDGSRFWANVVITALRDEDGTLVGFAKVTRDMTETHEVQAAAREDAIRQRRLVERLEELDEWRRHFISSVTHDLQTPVAAIAGFADLLLTAEFDSTEGREFVRQIVAQTQALRDLIDHLRTFSLLDAGRVELSPEPLQLDGEVDEVAAGMRPLLGGRVVKNEIEGVTVFADRRGLHRILQNLLKNAINHSPRDASIRVRARSEDGTVTVEVEDEGEGMAPDLVPVVFERYRHEAGGGTGLGLAIVREYVELHGGQAEVASTKGEGSTFRFTLPEG